MASTDELGRVIDVLRTLDPDVGDAERIDRIRLLEELKALAAAAQARETAAFVGSQRAQQPDDGANAPRSRPSSRGGWPSCFAPPDSTRLRRRLMP